MLDTILLEKFTKLFTSEGSGIVSDNCNWYSKTSEHVTKLVDGGSGCRSGHCSNLHVRTTYDVVNNTAHCQ